ncbi:nuclear transport factor 2 family protein [Streptomyces sp. NPDC127039]|uniref:nuclear transport factor 2 family protein n=1 Tax=Streptomyces sp. NPDC127039 TaxID=3347115 RepID=UPI0036605546
MPTPDPTRPPAQDASAAPGTPKPPSDPTAQLQWLVDRAAIGDLLVEFARALDEQDWEAYVALYVPEGVMSPTESVRLEGHEQLRRVGGAQQLGRYRGTWHLSSNHAIHIDGDTARTRSYLLGVHMPGEDTFRHADGAGWYDCTLRRTPDGWRFVTVRIHEVWHAGEPLPHTARP